jgi:hypothetical protein
MKYKSGYEKLAEYQETNMKENLWLILRLHVIVLYSSVSGRLAMTVLICLLNVSQKWVSAIRLMQIHRHLIYSSAIGETASGLQLTLNTQSSDIIDKIGQNGLKILLFDPLKDVELMSDYGINISPGFYTTIALSLEQVTNMKAPYGTCNDIELTHTNDTYSYSRCVLDQETSSLIEDCNCSMFTCPGSMFSVQHEII